MEMRSLLEKACRLGAAAAHRELKSLKVKSKGGADIVTSADFSSQEAMVGFLRQNLPAIPLVFEEGIGRKRFTIESEVPEECIVGDPFDGTIIGSRGCRQWSVSAAYLRNGRPVAGAAYLPDEEIMLLAAEGKGCFVNGKRLVFSKMRKNAPFVVGTDLSYLYSPQMIEAMSKLLKRLRKTGRFQMMRSMGSAIAGGIDVVLGRTEGYVNPSTLKVWDIAATVIAVKEAGGVACDCDGRELQWSRVGMRVLLARSEEYAGLFRIRTPGKRA